MRGALLLSLLGGALPSSAQGEPLPQSLTLPRNPGQFLLPTALAANTGGTSSSMTTMTTPSSSAKGTGSRNGTRKAAGPASPGPDGRWGR